jgi:glycosyltransferase involved in cell wall biosynthesis
VTKHNDDPFWRRPAMRAMGRVVARATAQWIAISEHVRRSFVALGVPAERITTVRYGLAADSGTRLGQREARARLGLPAEGEVIGAVGRLVAQKGHIELVRALAWLGDRFPKARVVLIGDGELREAIAGEARRLGVAERVDSLGWRRDAAACMPAFDVFAQPSHWEGFGLVLLEAMAAGVPIVASRASAIPEVVEEGVTGLLVPPGDADALAGALATVLADPERARAMGAAGRARLEARFGVERMARETVAVYDRAVAGQ